MMGAVTEPTDDRSHPDIPGYDDPRNVRARAKGMPTPVIAGGSDPELPKALADERHYGKLLVWMVAAIIFAGFVIGIAIALAEAA